MLQRRQGFTLIELLVSMALIIFIMAILSEAFVCCAKAFRDFKATGDMAERLRSAAKLMRADLMADHFEGRKRLSQPDFWVNGPPLEGFFRIYNGSNINTHLEGVDLEGIPAYLVPDHCLHFSVKLRGNSRENFFMAKDPGGLLLASLGSPDRSFQDSPGTFNSQWAEVAWYLVPTLDAMGINQDTTTGNPPTPLYGLYRRQRVAVPERQATKIALPGGSNYSDVSIFQDNIPGPIGAGGSWYACSASDLTVPSRRFGMAENRATSPSFQAGVFAPGNFGTYPSLASDKSGLNTSDPSRAGADLMLADVISFEVRFLPGSTVAPPANDFVDLYNASVRPYRSSPNPNGGGNIPNNPTFGQGLPHVFDTWSQLAEGNGAPLIPAIPNDNSFALYGSIPTNPPAPANNTTPNWLLPGTPMCIPMYSNSKSIIPNSDLLLIRAVQVTIRIWDFNTAKARQITIIQDM